MLRKTGVAVLFGMTLVLAGCPKNKQNVEDPYEVDDTEVDSPDLPTDGGPDGPRGPDGPLLRP